MLIFLYLSLEEHVTDINYLFSVNCFKGIIEQTQRTYQVLIQASFL